MAKKTNNSSEERIYEVIRSILYGKNELDYNEVEEEVEFDEEYDEHGRKYDDVKEAIIKALPKELAKELEFNSGFWAPEIQWYKLNEFVYLHVEMSSEDEKSIEIYSILCDMSRAEMEEQFVEKGY